MTEEDGGRRRQYRQPRRSIGPPGAPYVQGVKAKFWHVLYAASATDACGAFKLGEIDGRKGWTGLLLRSLGIYYCSPNCGMYGVWPFKYLPTRRLCTTKLSAFQDS